MTDVTAHQHRNRLSGGGSRLKGEMTTCDGAFKPLWSREIPYLAMSVKAYRHYSGLEVISIECDDIENVFIAGFRTENFDNTGVQHVIEHVVLGGSKNYRVKSPCEEMGRGSLATYINAETYLDRTLFPYASVNASEFMNGCGVYLDAVFNPLLLRESFMQEGWRYELIKNRKGEARLVTTGIVLNERRAQRNDLADITLSAAYSGLLPGHPLSYEAGGIPGDIEKLEYGDFLDYYHHHYGIDQARLVFYGNIPTEKKLSCVSEYLEENCHGRMTHTGQVSKTFPLPEVERWKRPRMLRLAFEVDRQDTDGECCSWSLNWYLGRLLGKDEFLGMELLSILLLEDDSSPLRRVLLESGLCEDLLECSDLEVEYAECLFIVGVVNCSEKSFGSLKAKVLKCMKHLSASGFTGRQVDAAFNQLRLRYQEITNGFGLITGRHIMRNWLAGQEPLAGVDYRHDLDLLEETIHSNPDFLKGLLKRFLLDNPHRLEIRFIADETLAEKRRLDEEKRLDGIFHSMTEKDKKELESLTESFRRYQAQADSVEALASFPRLKRRQLPKEPFNPKTDRMFLSNGTVVLHDNEFHNGVNYVEMAFDAGMFTPEEQALLPVFAILMDGLGVRGVTYGDFEQRLALAGADLDVDILLESSDVLRKSPMGALLLKIGALSGCWDAALDCLELRWQKTVFKEKGHIQEILRQCLSQALMKLNSDDDAIEIAIARSGVGISPLETCYDAWYGIGGIRRLHGLVKNLKNASGALMDIMTRMMRKLRGAYPTVVSYAGDASGFEKLMRRLKNGAKVEQWSVLEDFSSGSLRLLGRKEGIPNGKAEFCCVRSFRVCGYDEPLWAPLNVYSELLGEGFLQEKIRMSGGAYGGSCCFSPANQLFQMISFRDPNPQQTLDVFRQAVGRTEHWNEKQITGAIVGCIRGDVPLRASECCHVALVREMIGLSNEERGRRREQLLGVKMPDIRQAAEYLRSMAAHGWNDCLVGERRKIVSMGCELTCLESR
ncbi:MAG: insulinase family protein, partial [Victivallales bacterium]|nr:insulinase family protein [Victivallales bacterium]